MDDTFAEGPVLMPVKMDVGQFRALIEPVITETIDCCRALLRGRHHEPADLAAVLLVGGGTRIPFVTEALSIASGGRSATWRIRSSPWLSEPRTGSISIRSCGRALVESIAVPGGPTALAAAADTSTGKPIAVSGGVDGMLRVWHLDDGTAGPEIAAHDGAVSSIDVSADGSTVASGGRDGSSTVEP